MNPDQDITQLLTSLNKGKNVRADALYSAVYEDLHRIACTLKKGERSNHTLCANALVHEAYMKLSRQERIHWKNRGHFFAIATLAMRQVLVNYARERMAAKRGGGAIPEPLKENSLLAVEEDLDQILEIDRLLTELEQFDPEAVRVIECRYFTGLTIEETADALNCGSSSVKRHWQLGKAWLAKQISA